MVLISTFLLMFLLSLPSASDAFVSLTRPSLSSSTISSRTSICSSTRLFSQNQTTTAAVDITQTTTKTATAYSRSSDSNILLDVDDKAILKHLEENTWLQRRALDRLLRETPSAIATKTKTTTTSMSEQGAVVPIHDTTTTTAITTKTIADTDAKNIDENKAIWNARFLLLIAAGLYGTNFSVVKILGDTMPVGISSTLRFGLATFATLPFLLRNNYNNNNNSASTSTPDKIQSTPSSSSSSDSLRATILGFEVGLWASMGYLAQAVGLETTDASKSAFLCSMAVVIVPMIDMLTGRKLKTQEIIGVLLAVVGVAFLESGGPTSAITSTGGSAGVLGITLTSYDLASLFQPIAFGIGFWRMERAMQLYPNEATRSTAAQLLAIFLASAVFTLATEVPDLSQIMGWLQDPLLMGALFWTGTVTTALTVYMETLALKTLSASETTLILSTEPLWGAAFAAVLMHETFGVSAALGAVLVLAGCIVSNLQHQPHQ